MMHVKRLLPVRRLLLSPVVLALSLALVPSHAFAAPLPADACENVSGTVVGVAIPVIEGDQLVGFQVFATSSTGPLAGDLSATLAVEMTTPGGTMHLTGTHTFANTSFGTFTTSDSITVAPNGRVHDTLTIVDGASGILQTHGTVDLTTGALELRYHGRVCQA